MNTRIERVAQAIKKEVGNIIHDELNDPRFGFLTIMRVEVAKDLRFAKIYFSVMGSEEQKKKAQDALGSALGLIRHLVGERLKLRYTPEIVFKLDNSVEYSIDIAAKIEKIKNELKKK